MFAYLSTVGVELHGDMVRMYWVLLPAFVLFLLVIELLQDENPNVRDILRRVLISILLLYSFDWCIKTVATLGDAITDQINGLAQLAEVLKKLGPNYSGHDNWFNLRETAIYIFSLAAYIVAYLGFFVATVLTHFTWTILYVCSPLMILMFVSRHTAFVTASLYKGLIQVVVWKILWSILGVLLLKLATQPDVSGMEDYLMAIVMNLCIGVSMLFIPIATKSLISDGMSSMANTFAMAPTMAAAGSIKLAASRMATRAAGGAKSALAFATKPAVNPIAGRFEMMKDRLKPRFDRFKKSYGQFGLPQEILNKRNRRRNKNEKQ
jgi:hypothetical protein